MLDCSATKMIQCKFPSPQFGLASQNAVCIETVTSQTRELTNKTLFRSPQDSNIYWQIDLHWVQAVTVPMHLGLIEGPLVPHNLISVQESPVPLPKFQMAPRHKILMSARVPNKGDPL